MSKSRFQPRDHAVKSASQLPNFITGGGFGQTQGERARRDPRTDALHFDQRTQSLVDQGQGKRNGDTKGGKNTKKENQTRGRNRLIDGGGWDAQLQQSFTV